jgi:hypothetical protein
LNVANVESCGSCGIEHVDALGGGGSFDYGSLVDLGRDPLLISASYSLTRTTGTEEERPWVQLGSARLADPELVTASGPLT